MVLTIGVVVSGLAGVLGQGGRRHIVSAEGQVEGVLACSVDLVCHGRVCGLLLQGVCSSSGHLAPCM